MSAAQQAAKRLVQGFGLATSRGLRTSAPLNGGGGNVPQKWSHEQVVFGECSGCSLRVVSTREGPECDPNPILCARR